MSTIKLVAFNLMLMLAFVGGIIFIPPATFWVHQRVATGPASTEDPRKNLSLYADFGWASKHFTELGELRTRYQDFVSWRREDYAGDTINVSSGRRHTSPPALPFVSAQEFWFFGGSTTWGTGVPDNLTYPSLFAMASGHPTANFGETGYTARQSLASLVNTLIQSEDEILSQRKHIVFYDGVNDVIARCRAEADGLGTSREAQIRNTLAQNTSENKWAFARPLAQVMDFMQALASRLRQTSAMRASAGFSCHQQQARAQEIAQSLVATWRTAAELAAKKGWQFTAILQPVAYAGRPQVDYLKLESEYDQILAQQYAAVYPRIRKLVSEERFRFLDLTAVYDGCADCYIDFCHVGPQAHRRLVASMREKLSGPGNAR